MVWPIRRTLAHKLFGIRRRSRRLRHALESYAGESARAAATARHPADAANHAGRRAAYQAALAEMAGGPSPEHPPPPTDPDLARAWDVGFARAADHARRLMDEML